MLRNTPATASIALLGCLLTACGEKLENPVGDHGTTTSKPHVVAAAGPVAKSELSVVKSTIPAEVQQAPRTTTKSMSTDSKAAASSAATPAAKAGTTLREPWQDDFTMFTGISSVLLHLPNIMINSNIFIERFKDRSIQWKLTYSGSKVEEGELMLSFVGVPPSVRFASAKAAETDWRNQMAGATLVVEATCSMAFPATVSTYTGRASRVGIFRFEGARIAPGP